MVGDPAGRRTLYPDVITRSPDLVDLDAVLAGVDAGPGCSVKDAFAGLDLVPAGFEVLFEARWVHRAPGPAEQPRGEWSRTVAGEVTRLTSAAGAATLHDTGDVVGVSNVEGDDLNETWRAVIRSAGERPLVGYERGVALDAALASGAVDVGLLRVWVRPGGRPASPRPGRPGPPIGHRLDPGRGLLGQGLRNQSVIGPRTCSPSRRPSWTKGTPSGVVST